MDDSANPYEAPASSVATLGPRRKRRSTESESRLVIGPRVHFTGLWISVHYLSAFGFLALAYMLASVDDSMSLSELMRAGLWATALLAFILLFNIGSLRRSPPHLRTVSREDEVALQEYGVVELTFRPRLPVRWAERLDTADDIGVLHLSPERLQFRGDRTDLDLARVDVASIERGGRAVLLGSGAAPYTRLHLEDPLAEQDSFDLNIRSDFSKRKTRRRARYLQDVLGRWVSDGEAPATRQAGRTSPESF